ncbi:MAG: FecCD family ABC transporter permease [Coriobacteriales bacterium]
MASSSEKGKIQYSSQDIARLLNGQSLPHRASAGGGSVKRAMSMRQTNRLYWAERDALAKKVALSACILVVLAFLSLCPMGAAGQYYPYCGSYVLYTPLDVVRALYEHAYNAIASSTHLFEAHSNQWILDNVPGYWAIPQRAGVIGITLICAVLLGVSGMLYQSVFKNPIAGPGMLGVGSGVSLGMMLLVALYGAAAPSMLTQRYLFCYGLGAAVLVFVIVAGKRLSGPGRPFDIVSMLLIGSILSQLLGFIVSYVTLFVMDESEYLVFYNLSQMLTVDTSLLSWASLGIAALCSVVPILFMRRKMNALALDPEEARLLGLNYGQLRAIALVCGAVMILAAQVHTGMVALVSLIVPFMARSWFGCEFSTQLTGTVCIGTVLLLLCRCITDLVPFVGEGLAIGSVVSVVAMPLFVLIMAKHLRSWE